MTFYDQKQRYSEAANLGQMDSLFNLGLLRAYGRGCDQDHTRAGALFQKAAAKGHAGAMYYVGLLHLYGHGVDINYSAARTWFMRAQVTNDPAFAPKVNNNFWRKIYNV